MSDQGSRPTAAERTWSKGAVEVTKYKTLRFLWILLSSTWSASFWSSKRSLHSAPSTYLKSTYLKVLFSSHESRNGTASTHLLPAVKPHSPIPGKMRTPGQDGDPAPAVWAAQKNQNRFRIPPKKSQLTRRRPHSQVVIQTASITREKGRERSTTTYSYSIHHNHGVGSPCPC